MQAPARRTRRVLGAARPDMSDPGGAMVALLAALIVAAGAAWTGRAVCDRVRDGRLDARATCAELLRAPADDQLRAIREIGTARGVRGAAGPLALPEVTFRCTGTPDARLAEVITGALRPPELSVAGGATSGLDGVKIARQTS